MEVWTREFFDQRAGSGTEVAAPILSSSLPRAGSTLLEQILASHSLVEGTMELPQLPQIARDIAIGQERQEDFPLTVGALSRERLRELGERYLRETRPLRKTQAPYFIDKMPNNCFYVGLIHLILPNARIIDARRHPLACCFSCYKQHFARAELHLRARGSPAATATRALLAHFDTCCQGQCCASTMSNWSRTRRQVRRCSVLRTAVRELPAVLRMGVRCAPRLRQSPADLSRGSGITPLRPWLEPLKSSLGPVLDSYPGVPDSLQY